jgi:hypothetical protein
MRRLLIAVLLVTLLVVVGWLSFQYDGRSASVSFDTREMKQDTRELINKGEEAVNSATERGREMIDDAQEPARTP